MAVIKFISHRDAETTELFFFLCELRASAREGNRFRVHKRLITSP